MKEMVINMDNKNLESSSQNHASSPDKFNVSKTWLPDDDGELIDLLTLESNVKPVVSSRMIFFIKLTKFITILLFISTISLALLGYEYITYTFKGDNIYGIFMTIGFVNILNTRFFYFKNKKLSNSLLFFNIIILIMIWGQAITEMD